MQGAKVAAMMYKKKIYSQNGKLLFELKVHGCGGCKKQKGGLNHGKNNRTSGSTGQRGVTPE